MGVKGFVITISSLILLVTALGVHLLGAFGINRDTTGGGPYNDRETYVFGSLLIMSAAVAMSFLYVANFLSEIKGRGFGKFLFWTTFGIGAVAFGLNVFGFFMTILRWNDCGSNPTLWCSAERTTLGIFVVVFIIHSIGLLLNLILGFLLFRGKRISSAGKPAKFHSDARELRTEARPLF